MVTLIFLALYPREYSQEGADAVLPARISKGVDVICSTIGRLLSIINFLEVIVKAAVWEIISTKCLDYKIRNILNQ